MRRIWTRGRTAATALGLTAVYGLVGLIAQAQDGYKTVTADQLNLERLPATPLVFAAYAFVWIALVAYVFFLWQRLSRVEKELAAITARLEQRRR